RPAGASAPCDRRSPLVRMSTISTARSGWSRSRARPTCPLWARARALARVPRRRVRAATASALLVVRRLVAPEMEERSRRLDVEGLATHGLMAAERRHGIVKDLVHDGAGQALDGLALAGVRRAQGAQGTLHLTLPDGFHLVAQGDDRRDDIEPLEPRPEGLDLRLHDGLGAYRLAGARAPVLGDDPIEVVDVKQVHAIARVDAGI